MTERHKFADVLIAIAEGKTVQFRCTQETIDPWEDFKVGGYFSPISCDGSIYEWRVKPEVKKVKIVTYLNTNTNELRTYYYRENDNIAHMPAVLVFLNNTVVEVPESVYENHFE